MMVELSYRSTIHIEVLRALRDPRGARFELRINANGLMLPRLSSLLFLGTLSNVRLKIADGYRRWVART